MALRRALAGYDGLGGGCETGNNETVDSAKAESVEEDGAKEEYLYWEEQVKEEVPNDELRAVKQEMVNLPEEEEPAEQECDVDDTRVRHVRRSQRQPKLACSVRDQRWFLDVD
ncbi:uncharacterized protein RCC_10653 [Ramularia collo-cygni]|uniref:Uncharacterized protein n=1 Tax=Ramularia collo-cygni TaxID=112498 RepID=A0A2D3VG46_9PEZI|nr:uncharacterized protein RCC_10653 [Ramularia collo-cygni]CZT24925.1 uncharacterized protein RCC_10653 [Ramularia collo-cygni]